MNMDFTELLAEKVCPECGRVHRTDVKQIVMGTDVLPKLPGVIAELGDYRNVVMICDKNTYEVAGRKIETLMSFAKVIVLDPEGLHASEHSVETVLAELPETVDLFVAVGSGTVHDITRYTGYGKGIPFVSVPTAASVDGYVSNVAAMTLKGTKKTVVACAPLAMVADVDIIAEAPLRLTASGVGDMLGKYTALFDWKLCHALTGEYYCPHVVALMEQALESVTASIDRLKDRDREAILSLVYGLVLSGIAMQHTGISRPASGAEHHISHFIEITMPDRCDALHGEKVGVGLLLVCKLYHELVKLSDEQIIEGLPEGPFSVTREEVEPIFGALTEEMLKENANDCASAVTRAKIIETLPLLRQLVEELPTAEQIDSLMCRANACHCLEDIGLSTEEMIPYLYVSAPLIRNRLTLMRILRRFAW